MTLALYNVVKTKVKVPQPWASRTHPFASVATQYCYYFGTDLSWEGHRWSGVDVVMRHRQQRYYLPPTGSRP